MGTLTLRNVSYEEALADLGAKGRASVLVRKTQERRQDPGADGPGSRLIIDVFVGYEEGVRKPEYTATFDGGWDVVPGTKLLRLDYNTDDSTREHALLSWKGLRTLLRYCGNRYIEVAVPKTKARGWIGFDKTGAKGELRGHLVLVNMDGELSRIAVEGEGDWDPELELVPEVATDKMTTAPDRLELDLASRQSLREDERLGGFSVRVSFETSDAGKASVAVPVIKGRFGGKQNAGAVKLVRQPDATKQRP